MFLSLAAASMQRSISMNPTVLPSVIQESNSPGDRSVIPFVRSSFRNESLATVGAVPEAIEPMMPKNNNSLKMPTKMRTMRVPTPEASIILLNGVFVFVSDIFYVFEVTAFPFLTLGTLFYFLCRKIIFYVLR